MFSVSLGTICRGDPPPVLRCCCLKHPADGSMLQVCQPPAMVGSTTPPSGQKSEQQAQPKTPRKQQQQLETCGGWSRARGPRPQAPVFYCFSCFLFEVPPVGSLHSRVMLLLYPPKLPIR